MVDHIKVFVSYSWRVEDETGIVDELEKECALRGINLVRDSKTMQQGDRISNFMQRIAGASHVITVFSKAYFESEYCLYELKEVLQHKGLEQKIYPILADGLKISESAARREFIKFWENRVKKEEAAIAENVKPGIAPNQHNDLNLYMEFEIKIDGLMVQAGNILAAQVEMLREKQYVSILDLILPLHQIPPLAIYQPTGSDQQFMSEIKNRLQNELDKSNALRKAIALQVGAKGGEENSNRLSEILINRCEVNLEKLLRDQIYIAVRKALEAFSTMPDNDSPQVIKEVQLLTSGADILFANMVLYAIREQWMREYQNNRKKGDSNLAYMPFETSAVVEIVTSRHLQRMPRFNLNSAKSDVSGKDGTLVLDHGFEKDDIVTGILREIWIKVFPMETKENLNVKKLQAQIITRHNRDDVWKNNYYLIVPADENHPLANSEVRNELIRRLPELPLIILRVDNCADALVIPNDWILTSIILEFYQLLDQYIPYEPEKNRRKPEET